MNNWKRSVWPTATRPWTLWSIYKVSGKKECEGTEESRLCLAEGHPLGITPHRLPMQQALNRAQGKDQPLPTRPSSARRGGRQFRQQHWLHVPRRAMPGGPLGTLTEPGNTAACLLLEKQNPHLQPTLLHLSCTQRKWELDKEHTCLKSSTEPWLTPNAGTWHPNEPNPMRKTGHGRGSLRGSSPGQTCSHRWTAGWLSGLWWSFPWPSYLGEVPEMREGDRKLDS